MEMRGYIVYYIHGGKNNCEEYLQSHLQGIQQKGHGHIEKL